MAEPEIQKLYYSIGEVSRLTGLDAHVLRYWETEFRELSPRKNKGGKRLYRDNDVKVLLRIKELLHDRRYTIEGARKALREEALRDEGQQEIKPAEVPVNLRELRDGLLELRGLLD